MDKTKRPEGWYDIRPDETKEDRVRRLNRATYLSYVERNPNAEKEASKRWRDKHPEKPYEWPSKRATGLMIKKLKEETPCADCERFFPACAMDFDHLPEYKKEYNVGAMVAHGHNKDKIMDEISKCDIVCANCHRVRTRDRKANGAARVQAVAQDTPIL